MRKFFATILLVVLTATLIGCDSEPQNLVKATPTPKPSPTAKATPVVVEVVPQQIGVSKVKEHNKCDSEDCLVLSFTIGVQLAGETHTRAVGQEVSVYLEEGVKKEDFKNDPEILEARRIHSLIPKLDSKQIRVTLTNNVITKITFVGQLIGPTFIPGEVLWEEDVER